MPHHRMSAKKGKFKRLSYVTSDSEMIRNLTETLARDSWNPFSLSVFITTRATFRVSDPPLGADRPLLKRRTLSRRIPAISGRKLKTYQVLKHLGNVTVRCVGGRNVEAGVSPRTADVRAASARAPDSRTSCGIVLGGAQRMQSSHLSHLTSRLGEMEG